MVHLFKIQKSGKSATRKLPLLPRFGFFLDIAGRQISFRQVPVTETIVNLLERGPSLLNFNAIVKEQLQEIKFPFGQQRQTVDVTARTVARKSKHQK